jgi:hypothetical protein
MSYEAKRAADRFYAEGRKNSRPGMWRGMNFVSGAQLDAEDEQQRKLAQLELMNEGQLAVEDRRQVGGTQRTTLEQAGLGQRLGDELGFRQDELGLRQAEIGKKYGLADRRLGLDREIADQDFWYKYTQLKQLGDQATTSEKRLRDQMENELALKKERLGLEKFNALYGQAPDASMLTAPDRMERVQNYTMLQAANDPEFLRSSLTAYDGLNTPAEETTPARVTRTGATRDRGADLATEAQNASRMAHLGAYGTSQADQQTFQNQVNMRSNPRPLSHYNADRLAPLRSVTQPLSSAIGSGADTMVNRFQRQNPWTR